MVQKVLCILIVNFLFIKICYSATLLGYVEMKYNNVPIKGATITVKGTSLSTISDEDGYYEINFIDEGWYDIEVYKYGFKKYIMRNYNISDLSGTYRLDIELGEINDYNKEDDVYGPSNWQVLNRFSFGVLTCMDKKKYKLIWEKSMFELNYIFSPHLGVSFKMDGLLLASAFSITRTEFSSAEKDSNSNTISKSEININNNEKLPELPFTPNIGLIYYFKPFSFNYVRIGFIYGYLDAPFKRVDNLYYHTSGYIRAPKLEIKLTDKYKRIILEISSWYNFSSSFKVGYINNFSLSDTDKVYLEERKGDIIFSDLTLRYHPWAKKYYNKRFLNSFPYGFGFYVSVSHIYGKAKDAPVFREICFSFGLDLCIAPEW